MEKEMTLRKGELYGEQSADYFHFICGECGLSVDSVTLEDFDGVGFKFTARCNRCNREWKEMKVEADWGEKVKGAVQKRYDERREQRGY